MQEQALAVKLQNGDEAALELVIDKYARHLWSVVRKVMGSIGSKQDMEECVADVFITLWTHPEQFDASRGSLKTWLSVMARTKATDRVRILLRQCSVPVEYIAETVSTDDPDPAAYTIRNEQRQTLDRLIDELTEPDREIIVRRYWYDQKPRSIANAMDISVKQVENRLYRTKKRLKYGMTAREES